MVAASELKPRVEAFLEANKLPEIVIKTVFRDTRKRPASYKYCAILGYEHEGMMIWRAGHAHTIVAAASRALDKLEFELWKDTNYDDNDALLFRIQWHSCDIGSIRNLEDNDNDR